MSDKDNSKVDGLLAMVDDLLIQATKERSHFYTAKVLKLCREYITLTSQPSPESPLVGLDGTQFPIADIQRICGVGLNTALKVRDLMYAKFGSPQEHMESKPIFLYRAGSEGCVNPIEFPVKNPPQKESGDLEKECVHASGGLGACPKCRTTYDEINSKPDHRFVEVDVPALIYFLYDRDAMGNKYCDYPPERLAHALASSKDKWLKVKESS